MQLFGKEQFRHSENVTLSGLKSSLTYWEITKRDRVIWADYIDCQLYGIRDGIENIIQNKKD